MNTVHLHGETVTMGQESALRAFTESLPKCELRQAMSDILDALDRHETAQVTTWADGS